MQNYKSIEQEIKGLQWDGTLDGELACWLKANGFTFTIQTNPDYKKPETAEEAEQDEIWGVDPESGLGILGPRVHEHWFVVKDSWFVRLETGRYTVYNDGWMRNNFHV